MRKLIIMMFLLTIPFAFAISEGQQITQAQLDNQNIDEVDLECSLDATPHHFPFYAQWDVSCLTIQKGIESEYIVVRKTTHIRKRLTFRVARDIVLLGFDEYKQNYIVPFVRKAVENFKADIREIAKDFQTVDYSRYNWSIDIN